MAKKNKIRGTKRGDALMGSEGRDVVFGKNGDDVIITYGGNDKVMGGTGADVITTYAGNDKVKGGNGADTITTGEGMDKAWGGAGDDLFVTESDGAGHVKIMDFEAGDSIQFCGCSGTYKEQRGNHVWIIKGEDVKAVIKNFDADDLDIDYDARLITVATDPLA